MGIKNVLLVDDDKTSNFVSSFVIKKFDPQINVDFSENGYFAKQLLETELDYHCDVIFLDINMPIMNGFEFLEWYENVFARKKKPKIVMLSTSSRKEDMEISLSYNCVISYIEKPMTSDVLKKIDIILKQD
jgi:CheY-like chemotaxis protein